MVLLARTTPNTSGANFLPFPLEGKAPAKDHHPAIIGGMDPKKLPARLAMHCQVLRSDIKGSGGKSLLTGNVNTPKPSPVHPHMSDQVPSRVGHRYVHRLTNCHRLFFGSGNYPW